MNIRYPTVAGAFYPGSPEKINDLLERIGDAESGRIETDLARKEIIGCVVPHAGYVYSAYEAVHFFEIIRQTGQHYDTFLIINPNHTGYGEYIEVDESTAWQTPLGNVDLDTEFAEALDLPKGSRAQMQEHSAEVMLPLLQRYLDYDYRILPICMLKQNPDTARELAGKIYRTNALLDRKLMIIASSDFSHFETPEEGRRKDDLVLEQIMAGNTVELHSTVVKNRISVCGYGPIMTLMEYAELAGREPVSRIIARGNSGKTRPSDSVVDYITILFYEN